jgi:hypothetical protein
MGSEGVERTVAMFFSSVWVANDDSVAKVRSVCVRC